jgi:hypothetical protein
METEVLERAATEVEGLQKAITPNTVYVDKAFLKEKVEPSCSADTIAEKGSKVRNPFQYIGPRWICTGHETEGYHCYQLLKAEEWTGETRTYSVPEGREYEEYYESLRNDPNGFYHGMLVTHGKNQCVLVGPKTIFTEAISQEIPQPIKLSGKAGDVIHALHTGEPVEISKLIEAVLPPPGVRWAEDVPPEECEKCKLDTEDHTVDFSFPTPSKAASDGVAYRKVCLKDYRAVIKKQPTEEVKQVIPADILTLAREKAGTRAEVLDIHEILPPTHTILKRKFGGIIDQLDSPDECVERCTTGFHYAYDSADNDETQICYVCTNPKCLAQKKGAKTRAEHAEGLGKKQAETKAIKAALKVIEESPGVGIEVTGKVARATLKLVILAQLEGKHLANYYGNWKKTSKWIWDEVSSGTAEDKRSEEALWPILDKMSEPELTVLIAKMMFYYLTDAGSDIGRYEIKVAEPLQWFGIDVKQYLKSKEV